MTVQETHTLARPGLRDAVPFWSPLALIPLVWFAAVTGGVAVLLIPAFTWVLTGVLDAILGKNRANLDPDTPENSLFWYHLVTVIWPFAQLAVLLGLLAYMPFAAHLTWVEKIGLFFGMGVVSGTIGIVYAHELMHRPGRAERRLADLLLAMVFYGHFRSEHLLVHHRYVGTPRDPVTARFGEGFHRFFARVLPGCYRSAWRAEVGMLARKGLSPWNMRNPFWIYHGAQAAFLVVAYALAGWAGVALILFQGFIAIWQLELVNYVEHYGLTRKHLGEGRYEHAQPHHSWNATQKASNWLLINLQRHSDHHTAPARPFPLLQAQDGDAIPQLPRGYPVMTSLAMVPPLWQRVMNPRVRDWRKRHYPEISDWTPYDKATNPMPR
jgi:alkane 1-monooxygenase